MTYEALWADFRGFSVPVDSAKNAPYGSSKSTFSPCPELDQRVVLDGLDLRLGAGLEEQRLVRGHLVLGAPLIRLPGRPLCRELAEGRRGD